MVDKKGPAADPPAENKEPAVRPKVLPVQPPSRDEDPLEFAMFQGGFDSKEIDDRWLDIIKGKNQEAIIEAFKSMPDVMAQMIKDYAYQGVDLEYIRRTFVVCGEVRHRDVADDGARMLLVLKDLMECLLVAASRGPNVAAIFGREGTTVKGGKDRLLELQLAYRFFSPEPKKGTRPFPADERFPQKKAGPRVLTIGRLASAFPGPAAFVVWNHGGIDGLLNDASLYGITKGIKTFGRLGVQNKMLLSKRIEKKVRFEDFKRFMAALNMANEAFWLKFVAYIGETPESILEKAEKILRERREMPELEKVNSAYDKRGLIRKTDDDSEDEGKGSKK